MQGMRETQGSGEGVGSAVVWRRAFRFVCSLREQTKEGTLLALALVILAVFYMTSGLLGDEKERGSVVGFDVLRLVQDE
jgi:hypothetical protein